MNTSTQQQSATHPIEKAFKWSWSAFAQNVAPFILPVILSLALFIVFALCAFITIPFASMLASGDPEKLGAPFLAIASIILIVLSIAALALNLMFTSGIWRQANTALNGGRPTIKEGLRGSWNIILTLIIMAVAVTLGSLLLLLPGIALAFLLFLAPASAAAGLSPMESLKESISLTTKNPLPCLLAILLILALSFAGNFIIIGSVVTIPLSSLITVHLRKQLLPAATTATHQ